MKQFVDRGNLDVVQYQPSSPPDPGKEIRELDLRERIGMRPVQQHQVHLAFKLIPRQGVLGFTLDEERAFRSQIVMFTQLGKGPVRTFYGKSRVAMARVREHDRTTPAPGFGGGPERAPFQDGGESRRGQGIPRMKTACTRYELGIMHLFPVSNLGHRRAGRGGEPEEISAFARWRSACEC